jgi:hypothetical protein
MTGRRAATSAAVVGIVGLAVAAAVVAAFVSSRTSTPRDALAAPRFVDETASSGLDHVYDGNFTFATGGGVAALDCNDDGKAELYLAGGKNRATLFRNDSTAGGPLRFVRLTSAVTDLSAVTGAYPLDVDGDGNVDLAVLRAGRNELLRGLGNCTFEPANDRWSFAGGSSLSTAFSATWEPGNVLPTIAIGNYLGLDDGGKATLDCDTNELYRPAVGGARYASPSTLSPGYCALSMLFSDWDRSGRRDLRVTNDRQYYVDGEDQLWRIAPSEAPREYTAADGWRSMQIWGMGIASYDLTSDGYPDFFLTSQGDNKLQTLASGAASPAFRDIALKLGVTAAQPFAGGDALPSTAWHPEFQDVNNDGFIDLFISKGNVDVQPEYARADPSNLLLGQPNGVFREGATDAGIVDFARGRGAALADFNADGLVDLVEMHYHDATRLWRNVGAGDAVTAAPMGHWLAVQLEQPAPNRNAIGAWIEVRVGDTTLRRELSVGGGHAGGQLGWLHFGLGPASAADVRVQWPDGLISPWLRTPADQFGIVSRGAAAIERWQPSGG